jgi:hypothetical protein
VELATYTAYYQKSKIILILGVFESQMRLKEALYIVCIYIYAVYNAYIYIYIYVYGKCVKDKIVNSKCTHRQMTRP